MAKSNSVYVRYVVNVPTPEHLPTWVGQISLYFTEREKLKATEVARKYGAVLIDLFKKN
jgi:hypothetical protein